MEKLLWCMLLATLLASCNKEDIEKTHENTIKDAQLDAREENLLKAAVGDTLFTYDVSVDEHGGQLEIWLEKYEYGQLSEEKIGGIGSGVFEDSQILATVQQIPDTSKALLKFAVVDESGYSSVESVLELPGNQAYGHSSLLGEVTQLTGDMAIGQVIYSGEGPLGIKSNWGDLVNDPAALASELKGYPVVYLVRCSFKEETAKGK